MFSEKRIKNKINKSIVIKPLRIRFTQNSTLFSTVKKFIEYLFKNYENNLSFLFIHFDNRYIAIIRNVLIIFKLI